MNSGYALGEADTRALLTEACTATGLDSNGARLLRLGSNAVYRLAEPVVARIARPDAGTEKAQRTVEVARWLESVDYPAVRAIGVDQPVIVDGHAVTFWEAVSDGSEYAVIAQVAEVIARLHALTAPETLRLPELHPFKNAGERIASSYWLSPNTMDLSSFGSGSPVTWCFVWFRDEEGLLVGVECRSPRSQGVPGAILPFFRCCRNLFLGVPGGRDAGGNAGGAGR